MKTIRELTIEAFGTSRALEAVYERLQLMEDTILASEDVPNSTPIASASLNDAVDVTENGVDNTVQEDTTDIEEVGGN